MADTTKRALVVYGTGTGCTAEIAERIGMTLAADGVSVEVVSAKDAPTPSGYDAVLVGSGIRAGSWHAPVKKWVTENAAALRAEKVAFFTACLTLASEPEKTAEVRAYTDSLIAETGVTPVEVGLFAGINEPKRFPFLERTLLKMMKAPEGDFRDWTKVEAWTGEVAPKLGLVG
jgi:menaquinone-dependent protoporphyrinogen oxidase